MFNTNSAILRPGLIGTVFLTFLAMACSHQDEDEGQAASTLFAYRDWQTRWSSPENINGIPGSGGKENNGAKGRPYVSIDPGDAFTMLNVQGTGIIDRMWVTINDRSPEMLRSLVLEMFWDGETKPAVSVPFGDFFGVGLGKTATFQNALFANAEGRSFNCFIPMPFKKSALVRITNQSDRKLGLMFFDVDYQLILEWKMNTCIFMPTGAGILLPRWQEILNCCHGFRARDAFWG